jgi:uncharacterized protein (TIGR03118 family)
VQKENKELMRRLLCFAANVILLSLICAVSLAQHGYVQVNLVSDQQGVAPNTDPNLKNPWGISFGAKSPFWISNNRTGTTTLYNGSGTPFPPGNALVVTIPGNGTPTGQVFNPGVATGSFGGNPFIFVSLDGTISAWNQNDGKTATVAVPASSAAYTGVTIANDHLYAADFSEGKINVFDNTFTQDFAFTGKFLDPNLPAGFSPFNIQEIGGNLYVSYAAEVSPGGEVKGPGLGYVDIYNTNGDKIGHLAPGGPLNAPWGMALAPGDFGDLSNDLLVGNFGDGAINAYDASGNLVGSLDNAFGQPITIDGLWALTFGNGFNGGQTNSLYFTAGPDAGAHGLFGALQVTPEPGALATLLLGTLSTTGLLLRRRKS